MNIFQALILGIVQGLTEFLPVSSSGHLVIFEHLLNTTLEDINFDVFAHTGTLFAVLVYYRIELFRIFGNFLKNPFSFGNNDRGEDGKKEFPGYWIWLIVIGTIPAGVLGILFEDYITIAFKSVNLVGFVLIGCGLILLSTRFIAIKSRKIGIMDAILIGIAQALAMTPGLSRSGMTISMGLFRGVDPVRAADFSFLLSIPAVAGAALLKALDVAQSLPSQSEFLAYIIGGITSFVVGYLSIIWLLKVIRRGNFSYFGIYCILMGIIAVLFVN